MADSPSAPPLSVVVPTRDRAADLDACLASLRAALRPGDELIVADSASRSPQVREVAVAHSARYLRASLKGASRARNLGWNAARHDVIAFIDDDVRVAPGWAAAYAGAFVAHPDVGFMTGRLGVPEGQDERRPVGVKDDPAPHRLDADFREVPGHSANMAARRAALRAVGGFDERLGPGGDFRNTEDLDLFDRFYAAGVVGRYEPAAAGWHEQWRSTEDLVHLDWVYGFGMGARVAKLLHTDRRRARRVAGVIFWYWGLRPLWWHVRHEPDAFKAGTTGIRVLGGVAGLARCLLVPVRDGHFAPPGRWRRALGLSRRQTTGA